MIYYNKYNMEEHNNDREWPPQRLNNLKYPEPDHPVQNNEENPRAGDNRPPVQINANLSGSDLYNRRFNK